MKKEKVSSLGISAFCESMAMMLDAGIQPDEALRLLVEENRSEGVLMRALKAAGAMVEDGQFVSSALEQTGAFPAYMVRMITLGEKTGQMENVFRHLAAYYSDQDMISKKLTDLVRYPAVLTTIVVVVLAVMLAKVLPVFFGVYESMTGTLRSSAYQFVNVANLVCWIAFVGMLLLLGIVLVLVLLWQMKRTRPFVRKLLENLSFSAKIMECLGLYRFFVSLRIHMTAGEHQDMAVEESRAMVECTPVEDKVDACMELMAEGVGIAEAAYHVELLEPVYGRMLLAASRSGSLDTSLGRISKLLKETLMERVDQLVSMLEPILSGIMMLTIAFSLISVMLPLIGMMSSIG